MFSPIAGLLNAVIGVFELLLGLRFLFNFFGIGNHSTFYTWLTNFTQPIVNPFVGILPNFHISSFVIESAVLIAMLVLGLVSYFISAIFSTNTHRHTY